MRCIGCNRRLVASDGSYACLPCALGDPDDEEEE